MLTVSLKILDFLEEEEIVKNLGGILPDIYTNYSKFKTILFSKMMSKIVLYYYIISS